MLPAPRRSTCDKAFSIRARTPTTCSVNRSLFPVASPWSVGTSVDGTTGSGSGRAYVFDAATGALLRTLENPSPGPLANDNFGVSVSLSGTKALVGAERRYERDQRRFGVPVRHHHRQSLAPPFPNPGPAPVASDSFGLAVAVSGNRALIAVETYRRKQLRRRLYLRRDDWGLATHFHQSNAGGERLVRL